MLVSVEVICEFEFVYTCWLDVVRGRSVRSWCDGSLD